MSAKLYMPATAMQLKNLAKARAAKKRKAKGTKGAPSKTRPGRLDFVTHKGDKRFHRGGHLESTPMGSMMKRRPYM